LSKYKFQKNIRTHSKQALIEVDKLVNWIELVKPLIAALSEMKEHLLALSRKSHDLIVVVIVMYMILQMIFGLSNQRLEEGIVDRRSF